MNRAARNLALVVLVALSGCMQLEPITIVPDAAPEAGDAGDAASDAPLDDACVQCVEGRVDAGPSCATSWNACEENAKCAATYACARDNGCLEGKDFKAIVDCGIPCARKAGITDQTSPEAALVVNLVACIQNGDTGCARACHAGDFADAGAP